MLHGKRLSLGTTGLPLVNPVQIRANKTAGRRTRPAGASVIGTDAALLTESDLDAAVRASLLIPNGDGNYGFKSYAEAALVLEGPTRPREGRAQQIGGRRLSVTPNASNW